MIDLLNTFSGEEKLWRNTAKTTKVENLIACKKGENIKFLSQEQVMVRGRFSKNEVSKSKGKSYFLS